MCIFEYDEKREKELIRKVEYAEGKREGAEQIFTIYRLHKENIRSSKSRSRWD